MTDKIKRGDLLPQWKVTLFDGEPVAGNEVDLSPATGVVIIAKKEDGSVLINRRAATSFNGSGVVTMDWQAADTVAAGVLAFEVEVMWPGAKPQTFPVDDYLLTTVYEDLG
jgi:hypothetical protein